MNKFLFLVITTLVLSLNGCFLSDLTKGLGSQAQSISGGATGGAVGEATVNATAGNSEIYDRSNIKKDETKVTQDNETSNDKLQIAGKIEDKSTNSAITKTKTDLSKKEVSNSGTVAGNQINNHGDTTKWFWIAIIELILLVISLPLMGMFWVLPTPKFFKWGE